MVVRAILKAMRLRPAQFVSLPRPKRHWAQFSLGTMLLAVTMLCVWLADYVSPVRRLERQLRDPSENRRELAAERLGYLGAEARSATSSLLRATHDASSSVCTKAAWALSRVSGRADLLAQLLTHSDDAVRQAAAEGLLWMGGDPVELMPSLLDLGRCADGVGSIVEALAPDQAAVIVPLFLDSLSTEADDEWFNVDDPAASALSQVAMPSATVVPALIDRLGHARPSVRTAAAEQLLRLGETAKEAAPALRARLHDSELRCAAACAAALGAVDRDDTEFILVLKAALRSDDSGLRDRVALYLWLLGPAAVGASDDIIAYLGRLQREMPWPRRPLIPFKRIGPRAVSALDRALTQALADDNRLPATQEEFVERLAAIAWMGRPILQRVLNHARRTADAAHDVSAADDPLASALRTAKVRVLEWSYDRAGVLAASDWRPAIAHWLGMLGPEARSAVPTLIAALDHGRFQYSAVYALGMIGKDSASAVPALLRILDSEDGSLRRAAIGTLRQIGARDEAARARLRRFLTAGDRDEHALAALALAASGEPADNVLPILIKLSIDPYFNSFGMNVVGDLSASMAQLGPAAVPGLIAALERRDARVRTLAAGALGKIGPAGNVAIPRLIALLDDDDSWEAAAEALGCLGAESRPAVPKLIGMLNALRAPADQSDFGSADVDPFDDDMLELPSSGPDDSSDDDDDICDPNASGYVAILTALGRIGADARDAAPAVVKRANSDDPEVRHVAVQTLARIDPANRSLMRYLRRWLFEWERKSATDVFESLFGTDRSFDEFADAVWQLGTRAEALVPDLSRIMATAPLIDPRVRCYAAYALARFPSHRQAAVDFLNGVQRSGLSGNFQLINLADELLQRKETQANKQTAGGSN